MRILLMLIYLSSIAFPLAASAEDCPSGWRRATPSDIKVMGNIVAGKCIDPATQSALKPEESSAAADYLSTRLCGSKSFGIPQGFNQQSTDPRDWHPIKEQRVYFSYDTPSGQSAGMDPGVLRCFADFFKQAEAQGMQPCINAGLRSPAHQRSSCLDPSNSVVCGRQNQCTTDLNWYAQYCPHTNGFALDVNDKRCGGGTCTHTYALLDAARKSGKFSKVGAGASDPWHLEAAGCRTGGAGASPSSSGPSSTPPPSATSPLSSLLSGLTGGQQSQECAAYRQQCNVTQGYNSACMLYAQKCQQGQGGAAGGNPLSNLLSNLFGQGQSGSGGTGTNGTTATTPTVTTPPPVITPPIVSTTTSTTTPIATTTASTTPLSTTTVLFLLQEATTLTPTTTVATVRPPTTNTIELPTNTTPTNTFVQRPVTTAPSSPQDTPSSIVQTLTRIRSVLVGLLSLFSPSRTTEPLPAEETFFDSSEAEYDFASGTNPFIVEDAE